MLAALAAVALSSPITIQLRSDHSVYKVGEKVVLVASATNHEAEPIFVIRQGDGSQEGMKAPYCQVEMKSKGGDWQLPVVGGRCGNSNPILVSDFVSVKPNESVDLLQGMPWAGFLLEKEFAKPGTYQLRVKYDTRPELSRWIGGPLPLERQDEVIKSVEPLFARVPKGLFVSNVIQVVIDPHK